jgi:hypothetical protein
MLCLELPIWRGRNAAPVESLLCLFHLAQQAQVPESFYCLFQVAGGFPVLPHRLIGVAKLQEAQGGVAAVGMMGAECRQRIGEGIDSPLVLAEPVVSIAEDSMGECFGADITEFPAHL